MADILSYISTLHEAAQGIDGKLVLTAFGEKLPPYVKHFTVGDVDGMTQAAQELAQHPGYNVYAPLAVMRSDLPHHQKGTEKDVVAVLGFVADFDKGAGTDWEKRCPAQPSLVLETSPGNAQCFFMLQQPLATTTDEERRHAKELATRLTKASPGADPVGADLSHVWRIPGLQNWPNAKKLKEGRDPTPFTVQVLKPFDGNIAVDVIGKLPPVTIQQPEPAHLHLERKKPVSLDTLQTMGKDYIAKAIQEGAPPGQRSELVASITWALLEQGHGTGDITDVFYANPAGIGARYQNDRSRIEADVLRLAQKKANTALADEEKVNCDYSLQPLNPIDESALPVRPWLLGHHLMKGKVTVLIAPPGVGKSTISLGWAMSIATGKNLSDLPVHEIGAVGVINNEDDMDEMQRRIAALKKFHNVSHADLAGKFFLQSGEAQLFTIAKRKDKSIQPHHKDALIAFCRQHKIKALFVDPFLETHEADENDNRQISEVARMYREVAQQADCAVCLVHHTRKPAGKSSDGHAGNMDSARGASSLNGVARMVFTLYEISESDAANYGISEEDRHLYLRLDDGKANLSLKSSKPMLLRREGITLANGDTVGVLRVEKELEQALAESKNTSAAFLLTKIKNHPAFSDLVSHRKMKREPFIAAMMEAEVYLGRPTEARSTLQERLTSYLLGKGITDGVIRLYMQKRSRLYTIHLEAPGAGMPTDAGKVPAKKQTQELTKILPVPAESIRQIAGKSLNNHNAELPPL